MNLKTLLKPVMLKTSSTPVTNNTPITPRNTRSERNLVNIRILKVLSTVTMVIQAYMLTYFCDWRLMKSRIISTASSSVILSIVMTMS